MIKRYNQFIKENNKITFWNMNDKTFEELSGTELIGPMGPAYGEQEIPNTINQHHTSVLSSNITGELYSLDDYDELYNEYLKKGGKPLHGYNNQNLDIILSLLN